MKLRTRLVIGISLIWGGYLLLIWLCTQDISNRQGTLSILIGMAILFGIITLLWTHFLIAKIMKSNTQLKIEIEERNAEPGKIRNAPQPDKPADPSVKNELTNHKTHLLKITHYDSLTALPNRIFFNEMLNKTINHASRHKKIMAILLIDLDRFKNINDEFGKSAGDIVLKEISNRYSVVLRAGDILARLGHDEFIILLSDIKHAKFASPVAEKILDSTSQPIIANKHKFSLTASIGISIYPSDGVSLKDLQRNADIALHNARRSGRGIFQYYTREMNQEAHAHLQTEISLRKAISNNEFVLYYQPKLNINDGSIEGVEALIRWENPECGIMKPSQFIPLAEETGLITQISEWVLREACHTNKAWQSAGFKPISIAVNISATLFKHQNITQLIANILVESRLEAKYLELEITETAVMEDVEASIKKMNAIRNMGVNISIDDFGSGYTSISYLKKFPISILKIDQSFIKDIPNNQNNTAITNAIIALAHTLGIRVVAEGVENAEQLKSLSDNECDIVQGYYLSRPLPEKKIILQFTRIK